MAVSNFLTYNFPCHPFYFQLVFLFLLQMSFLSDHLFISVSQILHMCLLTLSHWTLCHSLHFPPFSRVYIIIHISYVYHSMANVLLSYHLIITCVLIASWLSLSQLPHILFSLSHFSSLSSLVCIISFTYLTFLCLWTMFVFIFF